jgi:hypothetical protein
MNRLFLIALLFISACNSQQDNAADVAKDTLENSKETDKGFLINGCYISTLKKDTATLKINNDNGVISGNLDYNRFEKDSNKGIFRGEIKDSLLIGDYTFLSEGKSSVRQVVFKISGTNLIEGYGDINMNGDTATFKNISQLDYLDDQP